MPIDYKKYPPNWKTEIRPAVLERDGHCCKFCGVPNHAVGYRNDDGKFIPTCGNIAHDLAGRGLHYPSLQRISYKEARSFASVNNSFGIDNGEEDFRYIVIVLTIMHLNHDTSDNRLENLAAGCQRCHNRFDQDYRNINRKKTNIKRKQQLNIFK